MLKMSITLKNVCPEMIFLVRVQIGEDSEEHGKIKKFEQTPGTLVSQNL